MRQISICELLLRKGLFHEFLALLFTLLSMAYIAVGYTGLRHIYRLHTASIGHQRESI